VQKKFWNVDEGVIVKNRLLAKARLGNNLRDHFRSITAHQNYLVGYNRQNSGEKELCFVKANS